MPVLLQEREQVGVVAYPKNGFGFAADQLPVQERQHGDLVVAADGRDDRLDARVGERGVEVGGALLGLEPILRVVGYSTGSSPNSLRNRSSPSS